jgi:hypothetical protein
LKPNVGMKKASPPNANWQSDPVKRSESLKFPRVSPLRELERCRFGNSDWGDHGT